jgi:hypothetical protein
MLKNCILILPVSDPAKQAAQVVKHHVFDDYSYFSLLLEPLAFLDQTRGESKSDS